MSRTTHHYSHYAPDAIVGIRLGVNAADIANAEHLPPRGRVMKLAAKLALLQYRAAPRNALPTIRVENIRLAQALDGGRIEATREQVQAMLSVDEEIERERNSIARARAKERKEAREAAAKRQKAREARRARKAQAEK